MASERSGMAAATWGWVRVNKTRRVWRGGVVVAMWGGLVVSTNAWRPASLMTSPVPSRPSCLTLYSNNHSTPPASPPASNLPTTLFAPPPSPPPPRPSQAIHCQGLSTLSSVSRLGCDSTRTLTFASPSTSTPATPATPATPPTIMARPRKDVKFQHQTRSASNNRVRRMSQSQSEHEHEPGSPSTNGHAPAPVPSPPRSLNPQFNSTPLILPPRSPNYPRASMRRKRPTSSRAPYGRSS